MRRPIRNRPRRIEAPHDPALVVARATHGTECSDFVDLARRMSIPDDHAIRQFVEHVMGLNGTDRPADRP